MNKEELIDKVYYFWNSYLTDVINRYTLKEEIENNINNGNIEKELDYIRVEFDDWEEDTLEYRDLTVIYGYLKDYKNKIESENKE